MRRKLVPPVRTVRKLERKLELPVRGVCTSKGHRVHRVRRKVEPPAAERKKARKGVACCNERKREQSKGVTTQKGKTATHPVRVC